MIWIFFLNEFFPSDINATHIISIVAAVQGVVNHIIVQMQSLYVVVNSVFYYPYAFFFGVKRNDLVMYLYMQLLKRDNHRFQKWHYNQSVQKYPAIN